MNKLLAIILAIIFFSCVTPMQVECTKKEYPKGTITWYTYQSKVSNLLDEGEYIIRPEISAEVYNRLLRCNGIKLLSNSEILFRSACALHPLMMYKDTLNEVTMTSLDAENLFKQQIKKKQQ